MKEDKQVFILCLLGLVLGILLFMSILTSNMIRLKNVELNAHILEDCQIDYQEYQELVEDVEISKV